MSSDRILDPMGRVIVAPVAAVSDLSSLPSAELPGAAPTFLRSLLRERTEFPTSLNVPEFHMTSNVLMNLLMQCNAVILDTELVFNSYAPLSHAEIMRENINSHGAHMYITHTLHHGPIDKITIYFGPDAEQTTKLVFTHNKDRRVYTLSAFYATEEMRDRFTAELPQPPAPQPEPESQPPAPQPLPTLEVDAPPSPASA